MLHPKPGFLSQDDNIGSQGLQPFWWLHPEVNPRGEAVLANGANSGYQTNSAASSQRPTSVMPNRSSGSRLNEPD